MTRCDACHRERSFLEQYVKEDNGYEIRLCRECSHQSRDEVYFYGIEENCDGSNEVVNVKYVRMASRRHPQYDHVYVGEFNVSGTFQMSEESEAALEAMLNSYMRSQTYGTTSTYTTSSTTSNVDH